MLPTLWRSRRGFAASRFIDGVIVAATARRVIAVLLHLLPGFAQQNQPWLLFCPALLAGAGLEPAPQPLIAAKAALHDLARRRCALPRHPAQGMMRAMNLIAPHPPHRRPPTNRWWSTASPTGSDGSTHRRHHARRDQRRAGRTRTPSSGSACTNRTKRCCDKLQEEFGLHELAIEDAHTAHQRTKIEVYGDSLFMVVQTAQLVDGQLAFGETHIFLGPRYLVTVRHGASLSYAPARRTCEQTPELLALGPSYGLYGVLDFIVDNLLPDRARLPRGAAAAGAGHLRRNLQARAPCAACTTCRAN